MSRKDLQPVTHPPSWPPTGQRDAFHSADHYLSNVLSSSGLTAHSRVVAAGDDRVGRGGIGPQLAPDAPALCDRWRQETLLLDD